MNKNGVYKIKGIKKNNKIVIKPIGTIELNVNQSIPDTLVERYNIKKHIIDEIYTCNLLDTYITKNKKLPMIYINVIYEKPLLKVCLMRIVLSFLIEQDIKDENDLINKEISGKFILEVNINNNNKELETIEYYKGKKQVIEEFINLTKSDDILNIIEELIELDNKNRLKKFEQDYGRYKIPVPTIKLK